MRHGARCDVSHRPVSAGCCVALVVAVGGCWLPGALSTGNSEAGLGKLVNPAQQQQQQQPQNATLCMNAATHTHTVTDSATFFYVYMYVA